MRNPVRLSVTIAYPSQILSKVREADRKAVWRLCDAVSVNILDSGAEQLAKEAKAEGCSIRTHSYPGNLYSLGPGFPGTPAPSPELAGASTLNLDGARQRGFRDGLACASYGAEAHEWNGEAGIWRGKVRKRDEKGKPVAWFAREDARQIMEAYVMGWQQSSCTRPHWDLSFLDLRKFYPNNPAAVPPSLAARFRVRSVMAYSTVRGASAAQNEGYYRNRVSEAAKASGGLPVNIMPGSGRVDSTGFVWGDHRALEALVTNPPAELMEVSPYISGQGGHVQLFTGNPQHPSIFELFRKWRKMRGE